jgi:hypothetical protein
MSKATTRRGTFMDKGITALLDSTFLEGKTYEIIATTVREKGKGTPNSAALGIVRHGDHFDMKVFKGSDTFNNLRELPRLGINVIPVEAIDVLATAALRGWGSPEPEFDLDKYEQMRSFPFLKVAAIQIDCRIDEWTETTGKDEFGPYHIATFRAYPEAYRVVTEGQKPIERGTSVVLEALVFATRWKVATGDLKAFLCKRLKIYLDESIKKGGAANLRAVDLIDKFLKGKPTCK